MTVNYEPDKTQMLEWVQQALETSGFEELNFPAMTYKKEVKPETYVMVNLKEKWEPYFLVFGTRSDEEDESGTLEDVAKLISNAMTGEQPTKSEPDIEIVGTTDTPPTDAVDENITPTPDKPTTPQPTDRASPPEPAVSNIPVVSEPAQELTPLAAEGTGLLKLINQYVGNDVLQVFGETGSGKSKFGLETAREAIAAGKKVYYLDTERNLTDSDIASLTGCEYKYTPVLDEIDKIVRHLPAVDVVILDSIGFPVLTSYARLSMKQKGDALLKLIAIFGDLKTWAYKHNGVAIVTNQPESEFNKEKGHILRPFGDKSQFAAKEIWKTKIESRSQKETNISITAFRSRSVGFGTKIAFMKISNDGVIVV